MLYAESGLGKSMFALSVALAVAGRGEFLGWKPDERLNGQGWRVLYVDGEMHIADVQDRARMLLDAVPGIDPDAAKQNLRFLARQHQEPDATFPSITEPAGTAFIMERVQRGPLDLVVLDNFSTLGEVEDENSAASFNAIQQFLLQLKVQGVATILVHHANKTGQDFRGSSKLAATFETIAQLEPLRERSAYDAAEFRVRWDKVRAGGPKRVVREVVARLVEEAPKEEEGFGARARTVWDFEAENLAFFDELKERLKDGDLINKAEIARLCGKTRPMGHDYIQKGIRLGVWTEDDISRWFALGKRRREKGQTEPPVSPDDTWKREKVTLPEGFDPHADDTGEIPF